MSRRTNIQWISGLSGSLGEDEQRRAHDDLGRYLHKVTFNYLLQRQENLPGLGKFSYGELGEFAQDFVQETLEKMAQDTYALLNSFDGRGKFTSWLARIAVDQVRQELRRPYWTRQKVFDDGDGGDVEPSPPSFERLLVSLEQGPEHLAIYNDLIIRIARVLQCCLEEMVKERSMAFWRCEVDERTAQEVVNELGVTTTTGAIYMHVYRAKRDLRQSLNMAGLDKTILDIFDW